MALVADSLELELSASARRVLAALLFSLGLHAALIGLLHLAPPPAAPGASRVLQVQLAQRQSPPPVAVHKADISGLAVMTAAATSPLSLKMVPSMTAESAPKTAVPLPAVTTEPQAIASSNIHTALPPVKSSLPLVAVPLLVDNTYYTAKEVDVHPRALQSVVPGYPEAAANSNIQGWVLLRIKLDDTGKVEDIKVGDASPRGVFDQVTLDAFAKVHFAPAQKDGRAVKSLVEIKVWFNLN